MATDSQSRYEDLLQLAQRLHTYGHPEGPPSIEIVPGGWPAAHAADVPMPDQARLLGSELYSVAGRPAYLTAIFDTTAEPADVVRAYEAKLREGGWTTFEQFGGMPGGFMPSGLPGIGKAFRHGKDGPVLMVSAMVRSRGESELRLRLDWEMPRHVPPRHTGRPQGAELMPPIYPPPDVSLLPRGGGGGDGNWHTDAVARTERSVAELESDFAEQLKETGWKRLDGRVDDVVAWSSWLLPGNGGWRGLLLVLAAYGQDERVLSLRIESSELGGAGWHSSMTSFRR